MNAVTTDPAAPTIRKPDRGDELELSVDALAFGGWTSLGAGLQTAVDLLAPTAAGRDAIESILGGRRVGEFEE